MGAYPQGFVPIAMQLLTVAGLFRPPQAHQSPCFGVNAKDKQLKAGSRMPGPYTRQAVSGATGVVTAQQIVFKGAKYGFRLDNLGSAAT